MHGGLSRNNMYCEKCYTDKIDLTLLFMLRVNMNSADLSGIKLYPVEMVTVDESLK